MPNRFICRLLPAAAAVAMSTAAAQAAAPVNRSDPLDAAANVPVFRYQSALQQHRRLSESNAPPTWREANEAVGQIGGWRAYAREASQSSQAAADGGSAPAGNSAALPAPAASAPAPSMPAGHGAHKH